MKKIFLSNVILFGLLHTNLNAQTEGDVFFSQPVVHEIKITFSQPSYWDSLVNGYNNDIYIKGDVEIDGVLMADCGVKFKGNSSYNNPSQKKSFKLDFNEYVPGQDHDGLKKLNLNNCFKDPSFLREKLCLDFLVTHNLPAPRCSYANVYLNGTLWGLYTVVEEADKNFLDRWFGDNDGNLFKGDPTGDLKWMGATPSLYYPKYELKTNETQNDWTDLVSLINTINNAPSGTYQNDLDTFLNTGNYIKTWAVHNLFANLDSYLGSGHNYYLYHDSLMNQFQFISWDVNEAFGNFNMGMNVSQIEGLSVEYISSPSSNRPLHQKMLANTQYKQMLYDEVCNFVHFDFSIWNMESTIDSLVNILRPHVYADNNKFYTNQNFEDNIDNTVNVGGPGGGDVPGIKSFIINRRAALMSSLSANGCTVGLNENAPELSLRVFPNPFNNSFTIQGIPANSTALVEIYNSLGALIYSRELGSGEVMIDFPHSAQGIYHLKVKNDKFEDIFNTALIHN